MYTLHITQAISLLLSDIIYNSPYKATYYNNFRTLTKNASTVRILLKMFFYLRMLKYIDMLDNDKIDDAFKEIVHERNRVLCYNCYSQMYDSRKVECGLRKVYVKEARRRN